MQEKTVEKRLHDEVRKIGGKAYKLVSPGNNGVPDRLVCIPGGRIVFAETKRPKSGRLSKIQIYRHKELRRMGFDVRVVDTTELVMGFIEEFKCHIENDKKEVMPNEVHTARLPKVHD